MKKQKWHQKLTGKVVPKLIGTGLNIAGFFDGEWAAKKTFEILCTPRGGKFKPFQEKFLAEAKQEPIMYKGMPIQTYFWPGKGPIVLLVHGWQSNAWRWHRLINKLRDEGYEVLAMDGPAHGATGGDFFNAQLYAEMIYEVNKVFHVSALVGHSVGAFACMYFRTHLPANNIDTMVLLGPTNNMAVVTKTFFNIIGLDAYMQSEYQRYFESKFGKPMDDFSAEQYARQLRISGAIIHDKEDDINSYEDSLRIHNSWRNSTLMTTEGLGHSLQSQEVYNFIVEILDKEMPFNWRR